MLFEEPTRRILSHLRLIYLLTFCLLITPGQIWADSAIEDALNIGELASAAIGNVSKLDEATDTVLPLDCGQVPARGKNGLRSSLEEYTAKRLVDPNIGRYDPKLGEFPPFVIITFDRDEKPYKKDCHGVILNKNYVLTTASCLPNNTVGIKIYPTYYKNIPGLRLKKPKPPKWYEAFTFCTAKKHDEESLNHDFAIIKLNQTIEFNDNAQPICLPKAPLKAGTIAYSVGMSGNLNILYVEVVREANCAESKTASLNCFESIKNNYRLKCQGKFTMIRSFGGFQGSEQEINIAILRPPSFTWFQLSNFNTQKQWNYS